MDGLARQARKLNGTIRFIVAASEGKDIVRQQDCLGLPIGK
jgi:hypothetical protein